MTVMAAGQTRVLPLFIRSSQERRWKSHHFNMTAIQLSRATKNVINSLKGQSADQWDPQNDCVWWSIEHKVEKPTLSNMDKCSSILLCIDFTIDLWDRAA